MAWWSAVDGTKVAIGRLLLIHMTLIPAPIGESMDQGQYYRAIPSHEPKQQSYHKVIYGNGIKP